VGAWPFPWAPCGRLASVPVLLGRLWQPRKCGKSPGPRVAAVGAWPYPRVPTGVFGTIRVRVVERNQRSLLDTKGCDGVPSISVVRVLAWPGFLDSGRCDRVNSALGAWLAPRVLAMSQLALMAEGDAEGVKGLDWPDIQGKRLLCQVASWVSLNACETLGLGESECFDQVFETLRRWCFFIM